MGSLARHVDLVIRARDESKRVVANARNELERFQAAQARTAHYRGLVQSQQHTANAARRLAVELRQVGLAASKDQVDGFRAARREARAATDALNAFRQANTGGAGSFAAFDEIARGATRADAAVEASTSAIQRNTAALRQNATAAGLAGRQAQAWASRSGRGPLGLRPYELQNLGYQLNDVFTQIASGTPVMQVAAQQGGQFFQIFPKAGGALLRFLPIIGLVTVALSPFITALNRVNGEAKTLSEFDRLLMRSGESASYSAQGLANAAHALDQYDRSLADARTAISEFVGDSVAPEYLEAFGRTALDFARVMKVDVAEASKTVSDAFTGNADAILSLDDELNFLTDSERKHILELRKSKKDAEARTYAFDIFARRYGETAEKMRGPWSQILANFGGAWGAFVDTVNFVDFSRVKAEIRSLMGLIQRLTAMLPGARGRTVENAQQNIAAIETRLEQSNARLAGLRGASGPNADRQRRGEEAYNRRLQAELTYLRGRVQVLEAQDNGGLLGAPPLPGDTTLDPPAPANTDDGRDREAEQRAKRQREFLESLAAENAQRRFAIQMIDQEARERQILEAIREKELAAQEVGLQLTDQQRAAIRETVGALYDAEKAHEAVRLVEQARLELAEARGEVESREDFVTRKLREQGMLTGFVDEATGELVSTLVKGGEEYAAILRQLYDINEATRQRQEAEKAVNDLTAIRATMQDRAEFLRDTGRGAEADALVEQIAALDAALLRAIDNALSMWRAIGGPEAEAAILRLTAARDSVTKLGEGAIVSGRQINEMLADGGAAAFDRFAQSIGEGVNAITSLRDAFLQFAADFLRQIAQMISKQAALNFLQGMMGGKQKGGAGGWAAALINGLFRHNGGLVGQGGGYRPVALAAFAGATRYHTGGIAGLKPNEVPAVLTRGEEVLTTNDPRHRANGGGGASMVAKVINVFDPADALERGLASEAGERVFLNFVRNNSSAFKAAIG